MLELVEKKQLPDQQAVHAWLQKNPLQDIHVDCTTTVMLKILDGKCKMDKDEKIIMALLYDAVKHQESKLLGEGIHQLIGQALAHMDETTRELIYEQRLYAEQMISRPVMKAYKAMLRQQGLIGQS